MSKNHHHHHNHNHHHHGHQTQTGTTSSHGKSNGSGTGSAPASTAHFELNSIKNIAETIGISNLTDEASRDLASDLMFSLRSIIIVSVKVDCKKFESC
jgi:hypothetical protein